MLEQTEQLLISKYNMKKENLSKYLGINVNIPPERVEMSLFAYTEKIRLKDYPLATRRTQIPIGADPNAECSGAEPTKAETHLY